MQKGSTIDINELDVIDGYFTVELDFGNDVFDGDRRWLEIGVRPGQDPCEYTVLTPRQEITAVPYALQIRGMFIDDDGDVAIGNPGAAAQKLHVVGNTYISGNLGIGATTPVQKLDVRGNAYISNNVGIGTSTPAYDLDVVGTASVDELRLGGVSRTTWPVGGDSSWTVAGNDIYSSVSGDVGIGTSNPGAKLHVYDPISGNHAYLGSSSYGVYGSNSNSGNYGYLGGSDYGVYAYNNSSGNYGRLGTSDYGVHGYNSGSHNYGCLGSSNSGVFGLSTSDYGVFGHSDVGTGVYGKSFNGYAGYFEGNVYVTQDVSALTFTDRTPYPRDLATAYQAVMSMEKLPDGKYMEYNKEYQLDHSKLSDFVRSENGNRDLSATVSAHNEVLKDLIRKLRVQEQLIEEQNTQIEQLAVALERKIQHFGDMKEIYNETD